MTAVDPRFEQAEGARRVPPQATRKPGKTRIAKAGASLALAGALLTGCGGSGGSSGGSGPMAQGPVPACPRVAVLADAAHYAEYRPGSLDPSDLALDAFLTGIRGECSFPRSLARVTVDMTVVLVANKGPAATADARSVTYFVAVVDSAKQVRARQEFTLPVAFPPNQTRITLTDELSEQIPLAKDAAASSFEVLVGFKLTPEQLERNRSSPLP